MNATNDNTNKTCQRLLVARQELRRAQLVADPDAPASRVLADGEARLAIDHFALTANNITYAAFGETMKYWQFFPAADLAWGCVPVWGFATVTESRADGVTPGQRVYGYLPMGTHLVVQPGRTNSRGLVDMAPHRKDLPATYNQLNFCAGDPAYRADREAQQAILRPLFTTSFLIDDFLADDDFFGAGQVWLSSASSKTAYGTAFCLSRRRGTPRAVRVVGLTSKANAEFARSLGCYDVVHTYDEVPRLNAQTPAVYIDFAGNSALRLAVHQRLGDQLRYSCAVGVTHWEGMGGGSGLPGPKPVFFFAPTQLSKRLAPPPAGWGPQEFLARMDQAWQAFMVPVCDATAPWLVVQTGAGAAVVEKHYLALLEGSGDARCGLMLKF